MKKSAALAFALCTLKNTHDWSCLHSVRTCARHPIADAWRQLVGSWELDANSPSEWDAIEDTARDAVSDVILGRKGA